VLFLLALILSGPAAAYADAPEIRTLDTPGVSAYTPPQVQRILRLEPGSRLRGTPEAIARTLEDRYHIDGYPAARVSGSFDAASGTLRLDVDEGRQAELEIAGLGPRAAQRARREAGLEPGGLLRETDVLAAFDRLEQASRGALLRGDYRVEPTTDGVRLVLEPRARTAEVGLSIAAFAGAGRRNRVDGWTQPLGLQATLFDRTHYNHTRLYARGAYATAADDWRWHAGLMRPFFGGDRLVLGYEHHDVTDSDDLWRGAGLDEAPGEALWSDSFSRYYARRGDEAFAFVRLGPRAQLGVSYRADRYASLPVVTDADEPNPAVDDGRMRSVVATLRFETGAALFDDPGVEREAYLLRSLFGTATAPPRALRVELSLERADADALGGDFSFTRLIGVLRGRRPLGTRHLLDARLLLGGGSELPRLKRLSLGGIGTLRAYPLGAFEGDRLVLLNAEYGFEPGRILPRLAAFYDGGQAWERGAPRPGWKSDLGVGLRWPSAGAAFLRLEWARALGEESGTRSRTLFRFQIPF
jgi:hypothetical protein